MKQDVRISMRFQLLVVGAVLMLASCAGQSVRANSLSFSEDGANLPGSYKRLKDTFEGVDAPVIHAFSIYGGDCKTGGYSDGSGKGDCSYGSVRSMLRETKRGGPYHFAQPDEAWYSWSMLIPADFPIAGRQTPGSYTFVQWKGYDCPHVGLNHSTRSARRSNLLLRLNRTSGEHDCAATAEIELSSISTASNAANTRGRHWIRTCAVP